MSCGDERDCDVHLLNVYIFPRTCWGKFCEVKDLIYGGILAIASPRVIGIYT